MIEIYSPEPGRLVAEISRDDFRRPDQYVYLDLTPGQARTLATWLLEGAAEAAAPEHIRTEGWQRQAVGAIPEVAGPGQVRR